MSPNSYTELFFLDEATALAAGHRPCGECRRADYKRFKAAWASAFGQEESATTMNTRMFPELAAAMRDSSREHCSLAELPDGVLVERTSGMAWLLSSGQLLRWTHAGYTDREIVRADEIVTVLTSPTLVKVIRSGYTPELHVSAQ